MAQDSFTNVEQVIPILDINEKTIVILIHIHDFTIQKKRVYNYSAKLQKFEALFRISVYPDGDNTENKGYISITFEPFVSLMLHSAARFCLNCAVSLVDVSGNLRFTQSFGGTAGFVESDAEENMATNWYGKFLVEHFIDRNTLLEDRNEFFQEDTLTLRCDVTYDGIFRDLEKHDLEFESYLIALAEQEREEGWFIHEKNADGSVSHSLVIGNGCPELWTSLCKESRFFKHLLNKDQVMPINKDEYKDFFNLMCCIRFDVYNHLVWMGEVIRLHTLADRYEVLGVKHRCKGYLKAYLNFDNATIMLGVADMLNDHDFKTYIYKYIRSYWKEVTSTVAWKMMEDQRSDLVQDVMSFMDCGQEPRKADDKRKTCDSEFDFYQ